jgi:hypothetical protein
VLFHDLGFVLVAGDTTLAKRGSMASLVDSPVPVSWNAGK